jgi:hypothetical protein
VFLVNLYNFQTTVETHNFILSLQQQQQQQQQHHQQTIAGNARQESYGMLYKNSTMTVVTAVGRLMDRKVSMKTLIFSAATSLVVLSSITRMYSSSVYLALLSRDTTESKITYYQERAQSILERFQEENETSTETDDKSGVHNSLFSEPPKWENSTVLPVWFKEYVALHTEQRLALNETNWEDQRYLIMRCLDIDDKCGGASDRLQSVPTMLALANRTRRMLFIKWNRPAPLQEFLVPPEGGLDWTIPDWLDEHLDFRKLFMATGNHPSNIRQAESSARIVTFRHQSHDHGAAYYNEQRSDNEPAFRIVFREMWDTLFTPSPPVAALIHQNMNDLNLVSGEYVASHIRSMYTSDTTSNVAMIHNGVNCATQLKPGWPIYFASDSSKTTRIALRYGRSKNGTIVARIAETEPLHLDRGIGFLKRSDGWKNLSSSAFYDVFVDLYLLAGSQCVAHGVGGYGMWGSFLSHNSSCVRSHLKSQCRWAEPSPRNDTVSSYSAS